MNIDTEDIGGIGNNSDNDIAFCIIAGRQVDIYFVCRANTTDFNTAFPVGYRIAFYSNADTAFRISVGREINS